MDLDVKGSGRKHVVSQVKVDVFVFDWKEILGRISCVKSCLIDDFWFVI